MANRTGHSGVGGDCGKTDNRGNAMVLALLVITILAATAAHVLKNVLPRYITTVQTASWQEARLAAEAGVDIAIDALNACAPDPIAALATGTSAWSTATYGTAAVQWKTLTPSGDIALLTGGTNPLAFSSGTLTIPAGSGSNGVIVTPAVFLDNVNLPSAGASTPTTLPTQMDVQVRAVFPDPADTGKQWFLIRSMGTSGCGTPSRLPVDRMDSTLRRVTLFDGSGRTAITGTGNWGTPMAINPPYATRIVEVLVKQIYWTVNAITTINNMSLGTSSPWRVDAYNSNDPTKSDSTQPGYYKSTNDVGANIATTGSGSTISANNTTVMGDASTNKGTVTGTNGIQGTISSDYSANLTARTPPTVSAYTMYTSGPYLAKSTSAANPTYYAISKDQSFTFSALSTTGTYYATLIMNSDWSGGAMIPSNVFVTIYIQGNISIKGNTTTNTGAGSSNLASHLLIFGDAPPTGTPRTLTMKGNPSIAAVFYGPDYDISLPGTADWYGSVTGKSYSVSGGGNGGMHFDESLKKVFGVQRFDIANFVEDARQ